MEEIKENRYVYGFNPVKEYLKIVKSGKLFVLKNNSNPKLNPLIDRAKNKDIEINFVNPSFFNENFNKKNHQNIVLKIDESFNKHIDEDEFVKSLRNDNIKRVVILDGIKDVGNLGAVVRSALLFGVDYLVMPKDNSTSITEAVVRTSAGATSFVNIVYVTNLIRVIEKLKDNGFWIYGADMGGENINKIKFSEKVTLVFGEEGRGIRELVKKNCDVIASIPTNEKLDSLNLSVSAGIFLYQLFINN